MELSYNQLSHLMKRLPDFELSYETISHNKVSDKYDICLAIPVGRKCYAWFTFYENRHVCYLFDLNREKKISKGKLVVTTFESSLSLGTIVYGTFWSVDAGQCEAVDVMDSSNYGERAKLLTNNLGRQVTLESKNSSIEFGKEWFIVEDILHFQGIAMKNENFGERLGFLRQFMEKSRGEMHTKKHQGLIFALSVMWKVDESPLLGGDDRNDIPINIQTSIAYPIHHIQYRCSYQIMPYLNSNINRKMVSKTTTALPQITTYVPVRMDLSKPQYKLKTIFQVYADVQNDIYHLLAYGKNNQLVYYGISYIPSYKTSVFMNSIFRNIRENKNLDYIEESDDEEDFQDMRENKYVNLEKKVSMECIFHTKFKKWVPLRLVDFRSKIVHIHKL